MIQAAAAYGAAKGLVSGIKAATAKYDVEKDAKRQATNQRAAQLAQRGSVNAWRFLGMMGGVIPVGTVGPLALDGVVITETGVITGGWASPPAKEQAAQLYRGLAPRFSGTVIPNAGGNRGDVGGIDPVTGLPMGGPATAGFASGPWLWLAIGALVFIVATREG